MAETLTELIARIKTDSTELEKGLTDAEKQTEASSKKMAASLKTVGIAMAASGAAITAAMGLMGKAAIDEEININRLATTLRNIGVNYDEVKGSLEGVIAATQRKTGIADSEQRNILSRLILITGDYKKSLDLLPDVLNLAAIGEMDATTAATYLGKAVMDLEKGAKEVGIRFGQSTVQFKSFEEIQSKLKNGAENLANPLSVLSATMGDLAEDIGAVLLPDLKELIYKIVDTTISIKDWASKNTELVKTLSLTAVGVGILLLSLGSLIIILPKLIEFYKALTIVIAAVRASQVLLIASTTGVIAGLGLLAIALTMATANWNKYGEAVSDSTTAQKGLTPELEEGRIAFENYIAKQKEAKKTTLDLANAIDPNLVEAQENAKKATEELQRAEENLNQTFNTLWNSLVYGDTKAGKLGLTIDDLYTYLYKLGYKMEDVRKITELYGNDNSAVQEILDRLGIEAVDVAKLMGKLRIEIDKGTDSLVKQTDAIKGTTDAITGAIAAYSSLMANASGAYGAIAGAGEQGSEARGAAILAYQTAKQSLASDIMSKTGMSSADASREAARATNPNYPGYNPLISYQHGGSVENTGLAYLHAGETVVPANESMGNVVVNFTQPVFFDREDTMNRFVDKISKTLDRKYRLNGRL